MLQDRPLRREDRLQRAAQLHLYCGAVQQYCETQLKLNRWHTALAAAPAVSVSYWKSVTDRYTAHLQAGGHTGTHAKTHTSTTITSAHY
jgi:hypothetical protein